VTSYIARLKAFNSKSHIPRSVPKVPKGSPEGLSSLLALPQVGSFEKRRGLSSLLSVTQVRGFEKRRTGEFLKTPTEGTDKTDKRSSITPASRAEALVATGLPPAWAEPFARLLCGPPPDNFDAAYWARLQPGANRVADEWAAQAHRLGWAPEEVFGLDDVAPAARWDRKGLAWLVDAGERVVGLDENSADIITKTGARLLFYRRGASQDFKDEEVDR
jgi:hypothetical protein